MLLLALIAGLQSPAVPKPAPTAQVAAAPTSEQFDKACADIKALVRACKWKQVRERWLAVLDQHAEKAYVRAARVTIEDDLRQAMFWLAHPAPDFRALISGEVVLFDRSNDTVRIRYETKEKAEPASKRPKKPVPTRTPKVIPGVRAPAKPIVLPPVFDDFVRLGPMLMHPLEFSGDYSVELRCEPDSTPPAMVFFVSEEESYFVVPGTPASDLSKGMPCIVYRQKDGTKEELELPRTSISIPKDKPYTSFASITSTRITLTVNGRQLCSFTKSEGAFGRFAMTPPSECLSIVVNGRSFGQWLDALVDESVREDRAAHDKAWKADDVLPDWLVLRVTPAPDPAIGEATARLDRSLTAESAKQIKELLDAGKNVECAKFLDALPREGDALLGRNFFLGVCLERLGQHADCANVIEPVCAALPRFLHARKLRVEAWQRTRGHEETLAERRLLVQEFPTDADVHIGLAGAFLRDGRLAEAWSALVAGYASGADSERLDTEARVLDRAIKGPSWRATQRVTTKHYEIASELDRDTCVRVGKLLEEAYGHFQKTIARPEGTRPPMRVFVFATVEGMRGYCRDMELEHTDWLGGMFSRGLQQLVVCELLKDAEFVATIRHEGFHQYLDQVAPEAPVWLNEGLAQYFEGLRVQEGKLVVENRSLGQHGKLRKLENWTQFAKLLTLTRESFYEQRELTYDLAWILVQYLMQPDGEHRAVTTSILELVTTGKADTATVKQAFDGVDMNVLGEAVKKYAATLF